jgi:hypothetical protein
MQVEALTESLNVKQANKQTSHLHQSASQHLLLAYLTGMLLHGTYVTVFG